MAEELVQRRVGLGENDGRRIAGRAAFSLSDGAKQPAVAVAH